MPLPIAIDVGVPEPPRELATMLVESCTRAAADTTCYLVKEAPDGPYAALAIITWDRDDKVRIEVGLQRAQGTEWRSRQLSFQPADVPVERYRSVGFVIGTLATASKDEPPETAPAPEPEPPTEQPPPLVAPVPTRIPKTEVVPEPPEAPPTPPRGFIGISAIVGSATGRGSPRYGGNLRGGWRVAPRFALLLGASASTRPGGVVPMRLTWLDAGAGAAFTLGSPVSSHVELRLELLVEHFSAVGELPDREERRSRVLPALRPGLDGVLRLGSAFSLVGGVELTGRPSKTELVVEEIDRGANHHVEFGASLGGRVEF